MTERTRQHIVRIVTAIVLSIGALSFALDACGQGPLRATIYRDSVVIHWSTLERGPWTVYKSTDGVRYRPIGDAYGLTFTDKAPARGFNSYIIGREQPVNVYVP